ncbi:hypothetical protein FQN60_002294%2C partial [Scomber scombrus]|uniref:Uncharacterized protein n=1 Tax=Scomber scombrus TaxID=13677 RepID=A0AAV1NWB0_SCOSC
MAPRGSPRQEDVTEAQEGKTTQSTCRRNSLCGGLWVSASLDIIRHWDPDVQLSGGSCQSERTK